MFLCTANNNVEEFANSLFARCICADDDGSIGLSLSDCETVSSGSTTSIYSEFNWTDDEGGGSQLIHIASLEWVSNNDANLEESGNTDTMPIAYTFVSEDDDRTSIPYTVTEKSFHSTRKSLLMRRASVDRGRGGQMTVVPSTQPSAIRLLCKIIGTISKHPLDADGK
jgi:hypothetical protein